MALIDFLGVTVPDSTPTGDAGVALKDNFEILATRLATSQYIDGLRLTFLSVSAVRIETGGAISSDGSLDIVVSTPLTVDISISGANGLDTGSEAADTFYAVFVIGDSNGVNATAGLFSISATSPTLPAGYDKFRRVGWVRNNQNNNFMRFVQRLNGRSRRMWYDDSAGDRRVLTDGTATTFTAVDCSSVVPSTAEEIVVALSFENVNGLESDQVKLRATGMQDSDGNLIVSAGQKQPNRFEVQGTLPTNTSQSIDYKVNTDDKLNIVISAYMDEL